MDNNELKDGNNSLEFGLEQDHLTQIYDKLLAMKADLEKDIQDLDQVAAEEKNDIRDNIRLDFADDETTAETYSEIEVWNRYIDTYNIQSEALNRRLQTVIKLLESPYFARISVQFDPDEEAEDYYIGRAGISENGYDQMVVDWRSPIAEVYYNQANGHTSYKVEDRSIEVDLKLRRQFEIEQDKLKSFFDTQVAIEDPLLLHSLSQRHSDKMQAITATIQKEQNEVIRHKDVPALLVNGIAGSGKTSVLLQRIAYLFYQQRETLRPDQVCLLTLNPVFRQYIDNVLPDLGESNPDTFTWTEFLDNAGVPYHDGILDHTDAETLRLIDECLSALEPELEDFCDVTNKGNVIVSAKEVLALIKSHPQIPMGVRLIQTVMDELDVVARNSLHQKALDNNGEDDDDENGGNVGSTPEKEANRIENDFGSALRNIKRCNWVNIDHIGKRLLGKGKLTTSQWLYIKMSLTGICDKHVKYIMIDEVQDYTLAQLMVFRKYYPRAKFMMLGDEFQAIRDDAVHFDQIRKLFTAEDKAFVELPLMTSYRSSPEITALFAALLPEDRKRETSSIQRPGEEVYVKAAAGDLAEYDKILRDKVHEYAGKEGLTAVICRNRNGAEKLASLLENEDVQVVNGQGKLPKEGTFILELPYAKGLEFDNVIVADADDNHYPNDDLGRHCLYTAMSRATQHLSVLAEGKIAKILGA